MKNNMISAIFRLKYIYYIFPFWITTVLCLNQDLTFSDLGHYIKLGDIMIQTKSLVSRDLFTHTFLGLQYTNSGWLSQILLAYFERIGGLQLLILLRICILLLAMLAYYYLIKTLTNSYRVTLLFIVYSVALGFTNWAIRPQLFAIPLFICFYSHLYRRKIISTGRMAILAFLIILWANLHSSFPLAIMLVSIFAIGELIGAYSFTVKSHATLLERLKKVAINPYLKSILFLWIILFLATLINPYGLNIWKDAWVNSSTSAARSIEWQPTKMAGFTGYCFVASIVATGIILKHAKRKTAPTEFLLLLIFMLAGFRSLRMVLWWGIVSAPILAVHLCSMSRSRQKGLLKINGFKPTRESLPMNILLMLTMLTILAVNSPWLRFKFGSTRLAEIVNLRTEPVGIAHYLKHEKFRGHMFNNANWGSYLIWQLWPDYKVFIDTRLHIIPQEIFDDYMNAAFGNAKWEKIFNKYRISLAVLSKADNMKLIECMMENPKWRNTYEDEVGIVYVREESLLN